MPKARVLNLSVKFDSEQSLVSSSFDLLPMIPIIIDLKFKGLAGISETVRKLVFTNYRQWCLESQQGCTNQNSFSIALLSQKTSNQSWGCWQHPTIICQGTLVHQTGACFAFCHISSIRELLINDSSTSCHLYKNMSLQKPKNNARIMYYYTYIVGMWVSPNWSMIDETHAGIWLPSPSPPPPSRNYQNDTEDAKPGFSI